MFKWFSVQVRSLKCPYFSQYYKYFDDIAVMFFYQQAPKSTNRACIEHTTSRPHDMLTIMLKKHYILVVALIFSSSAVYTCTLVVTTIVPCLPLAVSLSLVIAFPICICSQKHYVEHWIILYFVAMFSSTLYFVTNK